jgi:branched-chain amino acid transport system substrate-binding protein
MKKSILTLSVVLMVVALLGAALAGCGTTTTTAPATTATTAAATTTTAAPATTTTAAPAADIVVGAILSITGKYAGGEAGIQNGTQMAIDEINAAGGVNGQKLVLSLEDSGSEQAGAVNAYNRVVSKKPLFIVDSAVSSFVLAQMADIQKAGIPSYAMGENPAVTAQGNPWVLRFSTPDDLTPVAAIQYVLDVLKKTKVALVYVNNDFGKAWNDAITAEMKKRNLTLATVQVFGADDKDMTAQLGKVKSAGADAMIVVADPNTHAVMIKQRVQLGLSDITYVGSNTAVQPQTLDLLTGGEAKGIYALTSSVPPEDPDPAVKAWNDKYKAQFKSDADYIAADAYDAVMITVDAIKAVGTDKAKIKDWILANVKNRKGMGNVWTFSPNGDGGTQVSIAQVNDQNKAVILKTFAATK